MVIGVVMVIAALLMIAGCASPAEPLTSEADFNGFITGVTNVDNKDIVGSVAAESHADKIVDKYVITVNKDTKLFRFDGMDYKEISFDDLEEKQTVEIWFSGPVMESWPMQTTAAQIVLVD